ncbi:MAG: hypothetical protein HKN44_05230 [Ilumatobacter sp.]|nr:hypothetical protein [Ilumatobacter sp.]
MAWDSSRPVPWDRLMREWVIYALIMAAVFLVFFRDGNVIGALAGVLVSGPLYLALGAVLAKFGYRRKTLHELRAGRADDSTPDDDERPPAGAPRKRPAPTRRTGGGTNRPGTKKRRR